LRPSDPETIKNFLAARKTFLAGLHPKAGKTAPSVPVEPSRSASTRHATLQPMQIEELPTSDDDDDDIKTPDEPPAKGPIKLTAWAASASPKRTVAHMMMFPMISNQSSSGESTESEEEFPDISDISPAVPYCLEGSDPPVTESLLRPTVEMFLAHILGQPVITGVDTFAEITCIRTSVLQTLHPCPPMQPSPVRLHGVGGISDSSGFVYLPVRLQYGLHDVTLPVYIMPDEAMPRGVDLLLGVDTQNLLRLEIDSANHVIFSHALRADIFLSPLADLSCRRKCPPLNVLATCSGGSFIYCTFINLGFRIAKWYASEIDPACIRVATRLIPDTVYVALGDIFSCAAQMDLIHIDIHVATPPCQPWSSLHHHPLGFDDPRSLVYLECHKLHERLAFNNPDIAYLIENVCHHHELPHDLKRMSAMWPTTQPMILNAIKGVW
jgi:hypothetical protein